MLRVGGAARRRFGCGALAVRAPLRCSIAGPPFGFGYVPGGWLTAKDASGGRAAGYESATGDATVELWHDRSHDIDRHGPDVDVEVLGSEVSLGSIAGGYIVAVDLAGKGPACGHWVLIGRGVAQTTFVTIVEQLFAR